MAGQARNGFALDDPAIRAPIVSTLQDVMQAQAYLRPVASILNLMVKYQDEALDRTFAALSDPTRRALWRGSATAKVFPSASWRSRFQSRFLRSSSTSMCCRMPD